jgi:hypothetical protein
MYLPTRGMGQTNAGYSSVANIIQTIEGWFPGSPSQTNNNPGNLMYAGQYGATGVSSSGFAVFPDYSTGYQALLNQINLDASRGLTIQQFAAKYAPAAGGNNPTSYAAQIAAATGLSVSDPLSAANSATVAGVPTAAGAGSDLASIADSLSSDDDGSDNTLLYVGLALAAGAVMLAFRS